MSKKQTTQQITITVPPEELKRFESDAFESLRRDLSLPGFRKGTVSPDVARAHIKQEHIFAEAIDRAVSEKGTEAIADIEERIVGRPDVRVTKAAPGNPLEFTIEVHLLPKIDMSNWRQLRIPLSPKPVTKEDIDNSLKEMQKSRTKTQAVNRSAKQGDLVEIGFVTRVAGVKVEGGESEHYPLVLGESQFIPGFDELIVGMERGDKKTETLSFPKDWPTKHLAGKKAEFTITLNNVTERLLPTIDDTFAGSLGEFETLDALKESVQEGLALEREMQEKQRVRSEAVAKLGKHIKERDIPEPVIEAEVEQIRGEMKSRIEAYGMQFDQYLSELGKDEEELAKDWRTGALDRVRSTLVIRTIAKDENIIPDEELVKKRASELLKRQQSMGEDVAQLDPDRVHSYTRTIVINEMTLDLIERVIIGEEDNT